MAKAVDIYSDKKEQAKISLAEQGITDCIILDYDSYQEVLKKLPKLSEGSSHGSSHHLELEYSLLDCDHMEWIENGLDLNKIKAITIPVIDADNVIWIEKKFPNLIELKVLVPVKLENQQKLKYFRKDTRYFVSANLTTHL